MMEFELELLADRLNDIHRDALFDDSFDNFENGPAAQHFMAALAQLQAAACSMKLAMYELKREG